MPEKTVKYFHNLGSEVKGCENAEVEFSPFERTDQNSNQYVALGNGVKRRENPTYASVDVDHGTASSPSKKSQVLLFLSLFLSLAASILVILILIGLVKIPLENETADSTNRNFTRTLDLLLENTEIYKTVLRTLQNRIDDLAKDMKGQEIESRRQSQQQKERLNEIRHNLSSYLNKSFIFDIQLQALQQNLASQHNRSDLINNQVSSINKEIEEHRKNLGLQSVQQKSLNGKLTTLQLKVTTQVDKSQVINDRLVSLGAAFNKHEHKSDFLFYLEGWAQVNDTLYFISKTKLNYQDSKTYCEQSNMTLVSIHSANQTEYLRNELKKRKIAKAYIGLDDLQKENEFVWVDGTAFDYKNWARHEPNNLHEEDCVCMYDNGLWYDYQCPKVLNFICTL